MHRLHAVPIALGILLLLARGAPAQDDPARWPHAISEDGATVTVYQPQAISWPDQKRLDARAAIAIQRPGQSTPLLGTVEISVATESDAATRMVSLSDPKLVASHFPSLDTQQASQLDQRITAALPHLALKQVPLDSILLSLKDAKPPPDVALDNNPPEILHSARPASLVVFDGDPVLAPVADTGLSYAVNTNWDVIQDQGSNAWYLLNDGVWFTAPAASGPYTLAGKLPAAFSRIPNDADFGAIRKSVPGRAIKPAAAPTIFVSTRPAEIIVTDGPPKLAPVAGTALQRVTNTNATLYLDTNTGRFYFLTSGRWFVSSGLDGPWSFATASLPPDFAMIPAGGANDAVLAAVPGTAQAQTALIQAQIPHQATLRKSTAKFEAAYAGAPEFKPIAGTEVSYATNTADEVLLVGGTYYACYQGAWFTAPAPSGPWMLAASVPAAIYTIPPSAPVYNVTYVKLYGTTPETVTEGYTAGYLMGFVTAGVLAYGTGYYYPPVVVAGRVPAYFPYPYTYAGGVYWNPSSGAWARGGAVYGPYGGTAKAGAYYNPATGGWARGGAIYGPNGGAGAWSVYNPRTGTYAHGSAAWGAGGGTAHASFYNPRYGVAGSTTQNANPYGRWGSSTVSTPTRTVDTASARNDRGAAGGFSSSTGAAGAGVHGARGNSAGAVKGRNGNVYAGADGNVYRHTDSGWSKWNNGQWNQVQRPDRQSGSPGGAQRDDPYRQLDQDRQARQFGEDRQAHQFGEDRSFGGWDRGGGREFGGARGGRFR